MKTKHLLVLITAALSYFTLAALSSPVLQGVL